VSSSNETIIAAVFQSERFYREASTRGDSTTVERRSPAQALRKRIQRRVSR
jgi:hypothetical protein